MLKRRTLVAGMAGLPMAAFAANMGLAGFVRAEENTMSDTIATAQGDLLIHPVEHASLVLQWDGRVIYVDPVGGAARYQHLTAPTAILITHGHGDHFDLPTLEDLAPGLPMLTNPDVLEKLPEALRDHATALANGESGDLDGVPLRAIAAHNVSEDRLRYHPRGVGNGYVLDFAGTSVYVAGDTEPTPDMLALTDIDIAFLPMNLPYTMTQQQAAEAIAAFRPAIVYPYNYGGDDLAPLEAAMPQGVQLRLRNWYPDGA